MKRTRIAVAALFAALVSPPLVAGRAHAQGQPPPAQAPVPPTGSTTITPRAQGQNIVVHLTAFRDDPHRASMALELASGLQKQGARVTLFLDSDGVELADGRAQVAAGEGSSAIGMPQISRLYSDFVSGGGRVAVCQHCAEVANMDKNALRRGATLVGADQTVRLIAEANKIVDY